MPTPYANRSIYMMPNPLLHILCVIYLYLTLMPHSLTWRSKAYCLSKYFLALLSPKLFVIRHAPYHTHISFKKKSYNFISDSKFLLLILPPTTMDQESICVSNGVDECGHEHHPHVVYFDEKTNHFIPNINESILHNVSSMEAYELRNLGGGHWASEVYYPETYGRNNKPKKLP